MNQSRLRRCLQPVATNKILGLRIATAFLGEWMKPIANHVRRLVAHGACECGLMPATGAGQRASAETAHGLATRNSCDKSTSVQAHRKDDASIKGNGGNRDS